MTALLPPLVLWTTLVFASTAGGYPGAACMTPMAWLLALWSGTKYALRTAGRPGPTPLLGPALVGAALGAAIGGLFVYGNHVMMSSETRPDELAKGKMMTLVIAVGSVIACTVLSALAARRTRRRLSAPRPGNRSAT